MSPATYNGTRVDEIWLMNAVNILVLKDNPRFAPIDIAMGILDM
jgi:hypothetical protein